MQTRIIEKTSCDVQQNKWPKVTILLTVSKQVLVIQGDLTYL